jgi:16S rRNA C967 or C1407 C5-methylase (RsmB/RsmF family)/NOL1/NOP2/fmu family ribosome biogenesis protein
MDQKSILPDAFVQLLEQNYPLDKDALVNTIEQGDTVTAIRHHKKCIPAHIDDPVSWCTHAAYLSERPTFTLDPLFHAGAYYVQEASSMFLYHVLKSQVKDRKINILDLCAAPGGKSTAILDFLDGEGMLVCNEVIKSRVKILEENIIKWGYNNAVVTQNDPQDFKNLPQFFDVIVIDAPCSGEGLFRRDHKAIAEWSIDAVEHCTLRQKRIFEDVLPSLKPGGLLIYSTCTYNEKENMQNVAHLQEKHNMTSEPIPMDASWGIKELVDDRKYGYQFMPHLVRGEGFFISALKKADDIEPFNRWAGKQPKLTKLNKQAKEILSNWINEPILQNSYLSGQGNVYAYNETVAIHIEQLLSVLHVKYSGVQCGSLDKNLFLPHHALALSTNMLDTLPRVALSKEEALQFLNKTMYSISDPTKGWVVVTYQNQALGWIKNIGNRINNYYPNEWKIRMSIT